MRHDLQELESLFSKLKFRKWKHSQPRKSSDLLVKDHEGNYEIAYFISKEYPLSLMGGHPFGFPVYWTYLDFHMEQGWSVAGSEKGWSIPGLEIYGIIFKAQHLWDSEKITFSDIKNTYD